MNDERAMEVVFRLRRLHLDATIQTDDYAALRDAADEVERLREALKPFAALGVLLGTMKHIGADESWALVPHPLGGWVELKVADIKRAAEVLK